MSKFNIGDIVVPGKEADKRYRITNSNMKKAEVIGMGQDSIQIRVLQHEDDSVIGNEYRVNESCFEKVRKSNETIVIYRKGNTVIATDKSTGKTAQATCMDSDTFNLADGQKLAFYRLMGTPEEKIREMLPHMFKKRDLDGYKPEMQDDIKIGDMVNVVDVSHTFFCPHKEILGEYHRNFVPGSRPKSKGLYRVLNAKNYRVLIQDPKTTQVFIVGVKGIRKVEK